MDLLSGTILVTTGALAGVAVAYIYLDRQNRHTAESLRTHQALSEEKISTLTIQMESQQSESQKREQSLGEQIAAERSLAESFQKSAAEADSRAAALVAQLDASEKNINAQRALLDDANIRLTQAFAAVSRDALEKSNASFLQMAEAKFKILSTEATGSLEARKAQIGTLLKPLEETLAAYQKRLAEIESQRTDSYAALRQQIGVMSATQTALSTQTTQLISALTKPSVRGQWGEVALRRLVELAGMTNRCDFFEQVLVGGSLGTGPGSGTSDDPRLRPDMIVHLPADRRVVIDCKAVLAAFLEAAAAPDEASRQTHLKKHAGLVRARARELAAKSYWSQFDKMPEFVVLFLPGEAFFYAACEQDPTLIEDTMAQKVIIATPTTLIALLKSIEYGWRQQAVSENADEIRRLGAELYERLSTLAENMTKVGASLENAVENYNRTVGTLETRVLVSARKMGELGAKTEKEVAIIGVVEKQIRELAMGLFPEQV